MISRIERAVNLISDSRFYFVINPSSNQGITTTYSQKKSHLEDRYKMELYCQFKNEFNDYLHDNFLVDGEIPKKIVDAVNDPAYRYSIEAFNLQSRQVKPDLILHKGQEFNSESDQIIAIEIKTKPKLKKGKFGKDLFKVLIYKHVFSYQYSLFLIVNHQREYVFDLIKWYFKEKYYFPLNTQGVYIAIKEDCTSDVLILPFDEIIKIAHEPN